MRDYDSGRTNKKISPCQYVPVAIQNALHRLLQLKRGQVSLYRNSVVEDDWITALIPANLRIEPGRLASLSLRFTIYRPKYFHFHVLADRTATQYDRLLASTCRPSVRLSVCNAVHYGSRGRCTGLKVVPAGMFLFVRSDTFAVGCIV